MIDYIPIQQRILQAQCKIGKILKQVVDDPEFFNDYSITEICEYFKINKRTLKKYLKQNYKKKKQKNIKNLYFDSIEKQYLKDINKIIIKYNGFLTNTQIKLGQYYLNNLRN